MITLANKVTEQVGASDVRFIGNVLYVSLSDGREISVPMERVQWLNWLVKATSEQRSKWSIEPGGFAIYWKELDDGIEVRHLMEMQPLSHGIKPRTIYKTEGVLSATRMADAKPPKYGADRKLREDADATKVSDAEWRKMTPFQRDELLDRLEKEMLDAATKMEFERAAELRDEIERLKSGKKRGRAKYQFAKK
jgi:hypothetical protein